MEGWGDPTPLYHAVLFTNCIIGELVTKYFPEVLKFEPGTKAENAVTFEPLEAFLSELATDQELLKRIKKRTLARTTKSEKLDC